MTASPQAGRQQRSKQQDMSSQAVKIGICGLGTVGGGTFNVLRRNAQAIGARAQSGIEIAHVGARRDNPSCDLEGVR